MTIHGVKKNTTSIIVGDSDGLIALFNPNDAHSDEAMTLLEQIGRVDTRIVFPSTTIAETITTFARKLNKPTVVEKLVSEIKSGNIIIEMVDSKLVEDALELFHPKDSKQNTVFDAIVAAIAMKLEAVAIYSFDSWYEKVGLILAKNWVFKRIDKGENPAD